MSALKVEVGLRIPPAAGTWARNDLYTGPPTPCRQSRNTPSWAAASLPQMSGTTATPPLPNSKPLQNKPPTAEKLAYDYLEAGDTSLWTAIQHLQYEPLQRFHQQPDVTGQTQDKGQLFRVGAFYRALPGMLKDTLTHHNVTILLNEFVGRCHPEHTWTSVEVLVDVMTPPHRDARNSPTGTFLTQLSLSDQGHVWIEQDGGMHFQDIPQLDQLRPGHTHDIRGPLRNFQRPEVEDPEMPHLLATCEPQAISPGHCCGRRRRTCSI